MCERVIYKYTLELVFFGKQLGKFFLNPQMSFYIGSKDNYKILIAMTKTMWCEFYKNPKLYLLKLSKYLQFAKIS